MHSEKISGQRKGTDSAPPILSSCVQIWREKVEKNKRGFTEMFSTSYSKFVCLHFRLIGKNKKNLALPNYEMSDSKLIVMQKKALKLLRTSLPKYIKQKILLCGIVTNDEKGFRNRMLMYKQQRPKFKKVNQSVNLFKKKEKSGDIFYTLFRYLSPSNGANLGPNAKMAKLWKTVLPQVLKDDSQLKAIWIKTANEVSIPKLSRGYNDRANESTRTTDSEQKSRTNPERRSGEVQESFSERLALQYSDIAEQRMYTEEFSPEKISCRLKREREETEQKSKEELPPRQRCRLSCPLPPADFSPPDVHEFLPYYQSPSVKFSSLRVEFLPEKKVMDGRSDYIVRNSEQDLAKKKRVSAPVSRFLQFSEFPPKKNRNKNYMNLTKGKSHLYKPRSEVIPKMKALLFEPASLELKYDAVNAPTRIFKDEVLVQVTYSGVCGTDLFITEGKVPCGDNPVILGHEISGKVYAKGSDVTHVKPGDNIAVNAYTACCVCRYCSRGLFSACLNEGLKNSIGISKNGGWAEFVVVKKSQVYKIPEQLGLDQAALIQPLSCVLSAMSKLNIAHGVDILIQGLGLSGCLWASVLHSQGYRKVFVSDKSEKKRIQFESLNLNYTFIPPEDIGKYTADIIIECTGSPMSIEKSFNILNSSGQMCFFGKPNPMTEVRCIPYEIIQKEITIVGNAGNASLFSEAINVATFMGHRYLNFDKLGVKTFDLEDFREAFQLKKSGELNKIIFKLDN